MDLNDMTMANLQRSAFPPETPIAMAYVPMQKFGQVYEPIAALPVGTIFPELNKPWLDGRIASVSSQPGLSFSMGQTVDMTGTERSNKNE